MTCNHTHNKTTQCDTCFNQIYNGRQDSDEVSLDDLR